MLETLDAPMAALAGAWLAMFDPAFVAMLNDPAHGGGSWEGLDGCVISLAEDDEQ